MAILASHPFKIFTSLTILEFGIPRFNAIVSACWSKLNGVQIIQTHICNTQSSMENKAPLPQSEPFMLSSFAMFTSARMIGRSYRLSLDALRYIEVVRVQRDGRPICTFPRICGRGLKMLFDPTTTPATGDARRQHPNRRKMRTQRLKR